MLRALIAALLFSFLTLGTPHQIQAQQSSESGWVLPVNDTLRILLVFIELEYDTMPHLEDLPDGKPEWPKGGLPAYADSIFDPFSADNPVGKMTAYYKEASLGNFVVLGDYLPELIRLPYSSVMRGGVSAVLKETNNVINRDSIYISAHGMGMKDFDFWEKSKGKGFEHNKSGDELLGVDHVMLLVRNYHKLGSAGGQTSGSSILEMDGKRTDSYSIFSAGHGFPFGILRHELNHLFLGGNNFHASGGNALGFKSYFTTLQGGWGMMGGAGSSFLTSTGWDRHRLGWKASENQYLISARDSLKREVDADLDAMEPSDAGIYFLRDFQTVGDAIRVRLPYIPDHQFPQWLWLENHVTQNYNGSQFDVFQYEHFDCTSYSRAGLYLKVQVDAHMKEGSNIFNTVNADYLRPILANGNYDFQWNDEKLELDYCVGGGASYAYELLDEWENPLSGNHEQEHIMRDLGDKPAIIDFEDHFQAVTRKVPDGFQRLNVFGHADHAFRKDGKNQVGIGSNPTTASMLTAVNSRRPFRPDDRNNTEVNLNGISIAILEQFPDGTVKIQLRFDDHIMEENRRWCAPGIVLSNHNPTGADLIVERILILDRGQTATRFDQPDTVGGMQVFTDLTHMRVTKDALLQNEGRIVLKYDSKLTIAAGAEMILARKSRMLLQDGSQLIVEPGAEVNGKGRIRIGRNARIYASDQEQHTLLRKRTWQKRRIILESR